MRKVLLTAFAVFMVAIVIGCGTTTSDSEPVAPSSEEPAAEEQAAGIGDTLSIAGNEAKLEVTLVKTKRVKAVKLYGSEMSPAAYAVQMTIKNVGDTVYDDSVSNCAVLIDTKDQSHNAEFGMVTKSGDPVPGMLESVKIAPGDKRSGWVFFAMKPSQKARTLQYTAESGFGPEVGEWSLQ